MQSKLKTIFSNIKFLQCCGIIAVIASLAQVVMCILSGNYFLSFEMLVAVVAVVCTMIASKKQPQAANLPVAAAMMLYLLRYAERFFTYLSYPEVAATRLIAISILPILMAVMMLLHLAMHITDNRSKLINTQQILYVIVVLYGCLARVNGAIKAADTYTMIAYVISGIALVCTYLTLCSAEVRQ